MSEQKPMTLNKLKFIFSACFFSLAIYLSAQPVVMPLGSNGAQTGKDHGPLVPASRSDTVLHLPFVEDFSYSWYRPDINKWIDNQVYINADLPINPPSWGVATFDGLDSEGNPYSATNIQGGADTLTSKIIDLAVLPSDSVYLSFWYQPKGRGNFPEFVDSFRLEFKNRDDSVWTYIWSTKGEDYPQNYTDFKRVMIPIRDTAFLKDTFQFRFRNYAQLNGSWDHWHLDYIELDAHRSWSDTTNNDVAFMYRASSLLRDYQSVPLTHYLPQAIENMDETYRLSLSNNNTGTTNKLYAYKFFNSDVNPLHPVDSLNGEAQGPIPFKQEYQFEDPVKYTYEDPGPGHDFTVFTLKHYLTENTDNIVTNDTTIYYQVLSNYYALDDGTAEERLSLNNNGGGFVAQRFDTYLSDTLKSIQFYFNKADDGIPSQPFYIMVWAAGSNVPGELKLSQGVTYPVYDGLNTFHTYVLDEPLYLPAGSYYFGWGQTAGFNLNLGFDRNFNNNDRIFYNLSGSWYNFSANEGTMMIRPLFGKALDRYVAIDADPDNMESWNIYPNPSDAFFTIQSQPESASGSSVTVYDISGRQVVNALLPGNLLQISTMNLADGIYVVAVTDKITGLRTVKKLAVKH